jgi:hypothetical protein
VFKPENHRKSQNEQEVWFMPFSHVNHMVQLKWECSINSNFVERMRVSKTAWKTELEWRQEGRAGPGARDIVMT